VDRVFNGTITAPKEVARVFFIGVGRIDVGQRKEIVWRKRAKLRPLLWIKKSARDCTQVYRLAHGGLLNHAQYYKPFANTFDFGSCNSLFFEFNSPFRQKNSLFRFAGNLALSD
jgi:hypothetical protein